MEPSLPGIHLACAGGVAVIRINGRAAVERARDFDAAVRQMAVQGVREVHLALAGCPLLDSTFSGTLAGLAEASHDGKPLVQFVLHDARARIVDGLANLEVLPLLRVAPEGEPLPVDAPMHALPSGVASREDIGRFCLDAHENLGRLSQANESRFADLRRMLGEELTRGGGLGPGQAKGTGEPTATPAAP
jgi:anti-anti-sigma regulatory factor